MVSRGWVFTAFDLQNFNPISECTPANALKYGIYQLEQCPSTGTVHVQGYFEFVRGVRRTHVQRVVGDHTAHADPRRGSPQDARRYCCKPETRLTQPTEFGELPSGQGQRTDLQAAFRAMDEGATPAQISITHTAVWARYFRAMDRYYLEHLSRTRKPRVDVYVYYGAPGSGKTRRCYDEAETGGLTIHRVMPPHARGAPLWFDGYRQQQVVLFDDFYGWMPYQLLLALLDIYPLDVKIHGGVVPWTTTIIYITSNAPP